MNIILYTIIVAVIIAFLLGVLLGRAERYLDGRLVVTYETLEDTKKWGLEGRDSDSLYQLMLSAKGVEAVVFLRQDTPTTCTGGFRSQDKIDVSAVAAKFGGGGHKNASGGKLQCSMEEALEKVKAAIEAYADQLKD